MGMKEPKKHGFNLEKHQKAILKSSHSRTDELLKQAQKLGLTKIYTDKNGRIRRKNEKFVLPNH